METAVAKPPRKRKPVPVKAAIKPAESTIFSSVFANVSFPIRLMENHTLESVEIPKAGQILSDAKPLGIASKPLNKGGFPPKNRIMLSGHAKPLGVLNGIPLNKCLVGMASCIYMIRSATLEKVIIEKVGVGAQRSQEIDIKRFLGWMQDPEVKILHVHKAVTYQVYRAYAP